MVFSLIQKTLSPLWQRRFQLGVSANSAVEFALISPVALVLMLGLIDFGRVIEQRTALVSAARAAGQVALEYPDDEDVIRAYAAGALGFDPGSSGFGEGFSFDFESFCACNNGETIACDETCDEGSTGQYRRIILGGSQSTFFDYPGIGDPVELNVDISLRVR